MKNIHVMPTNKSSRLVSFEQTTNVQGIDKPKTFYKLLGGIHSIEQIHQVGYVSNHIYITNDEEIKEGDWVITNNGLLAKVTTEFDWHFINSKKIILTTDQDLIKDGVQAIDDEFLEWFVKNPSCEFVEVCKNPFYEQSNYEYYKIIPKEELDYSHLLQPIGTKQETLEEFALKLFPDKSFWIGSGDTSRLYDPNLNDRERWIQGAKWKQERSYSEEEVIDLLETQRGNSYVAILSATKDDELASIALRAPEPGGINGSWKNKKK